jgi:nucleoside-diphosphate-sugar epimerase
MNSVLIVGGAGYVGAELQKYLALKSYNISVFDTFWYPDGKWNVIEGEFAKKIRYIQGDVRDESAMQEALQGVDTVIHLACISNDPSYELNPKLSREVNYVSFVNFLELLNGSAVKQLIYASSSSVYGVKSEPEVTEDLVCEPRTDYSKFKVLCEELIKERLNSNINRTILRPSTVCGYSKRQRFDLVVNILTIQALTTREIRVDGGGQFRPNLHIDDMCRAYSCILEAPQEVVNGKTYNIAGENLTVMDIANRVRSIVGNDTKIEVLPVVDDRSYRVSGKSIMKDLDFKPLKTVDDAILDIKNAYLSGAFIDIQASKFYNIRTMKELKL